MSNGYDPNIISGVDVSKADRQGGYDTGLLHKESPAPASTEGPYGRPQRSEPPVTTHQFPPIRTPFYRTTRGIVVIVVAAIVVLGAVIGGAVGGTVGKHSSKGRPVQVPSTSAKSSTTSTGNATAPGGTMTANSSSSLPPGLSRSSLSLPTANPTPQ